MQKWMKIDGMKCVRCEAKVKDALEKSPAVAAADVSAKQGTACVTLNEELSDSDLKKIVEDAGYTVKDVLDHEPKKGLFSLFKA